ncbi:MAG: hypothetical protein JNK38_03865 [Acidobacteria bacterium]|nr:hypothetical protein [Acidobacteriota bacterium]
MNNSTAKLIAKKDRFMRDRLPVRLGNLASNLARIDSISKHPSLGDSASKVVTESKYFIEWTAAEASLIQQVELLELQRTLARWGLSWNELWNDPEKRNHIGSEARYWSNRVLALSGLLE